MTEFVDYSSKNKAYRCHVLFTSGKDDPFLQKLKRLAIHHRWSHVLSTNKTYGYTIGAARLYIIFGTHGMPRILNSNQGG